MLYARLVSAWLALACSVADKLAVLAGPCKSKHGMTQLDSMKGWATLLAQGGTACLTAQCS